MHRRGLLGGMAAAGAMFVGLAAGSGAAAQSGALSDVPAAPPPKIDPNNTVYIDLAHAGSDKVYGRVVIRLRPDLAPKFVERVKLLCHEHFYDGTPFHRVIEGFMAQGGDPTGTGMGHSKYPDVPAEFTEQEHFLRGTVGAARGSDPDNNNSQFFIMFAPGTALDGNYDIWGNVISGMEYVDMIKRGDPENNGKVDQPDRIVKMRLASEENQ